MLATIEDQAVRAARQVRELLDWHDADAALVLARELLREWQKTQPTDAPHPEPPLP